MDTAEAIRLLKDIHTQMKRVHEKTKRGTNVSRDELLFWLGFTFGRVEEALVALDALTPEERGKPVDIRVVEH